MKTDLFQSCGQCWVFQLCWHIECSTFTASSFRIWNSSAGIPSPPLALFILMLPKAHLTSHSRMSGSRWVITPSWLSESWRSLYSSSVLLQVSLDFLPLHSRPLWWKGHLFWMLVLEGLVGLQRTIQLQILQHYWSGHRLELLWYWMFCLRNEQRSFCCFWDCTQELHFGLSCWLWMMATPFPLRGSCPW